MARPALLRRGVRCVGEPVGRVEGRDIELGARELGLFKPSLLLLEVTWVTLELWKPCLPETPVLRQWLNGCFLSSTLYQAAEKQGLLFRVMATVELYGQEQDSFIHFDEFFACAYQLLLLKNNAHLHTSVNNE